MRGKGIGTHSAATTTQDHPRLCGEKLEKHGKKIINLGSPPPMRGKAFRWIHVVICQGITPAYAGKSRSSLISVHHKVGSPPPMRGKVVVKDWCDEHGRITPAYAGKSLLWRL